MLRFSQNLQLYLKCYLKKSKKKSIEQQHWFVSAKPVKEVPKLEAPKFIVAIETLELDEDDTAKFTAKAVGVPTPELIWYKGENQIGETDTEFVVEHGEPGESSLVIVSVRPDHDDTYTCEAHNEAGTDTCKAELFVEGKTEGNADFQVSACWL